MKEFHQKNENWLWLVTFNVMSSQISITDDAENTKQNIQTLILNGNHRYGREQLC